MDEPLIRLRGVGREFPSGEQTVRALEAVDLDIEAGELVAIIGASGSGKSTLMNVLGCLDRPTSGAYRIAGRDTAELDPDQLAELRREHFGFIFQRYHLIGELSAVDNVEMPAVYAGQGRGARRRRAAELLSQLGLGDRLHHRPSQLSGGQQQRVSIARALMNGGEVILADEPTGALDSRSGQEVIGLLKQINAEGRTVIIVTHDPAVAAHARRIIELSDGRVLADRPNPRDEPTATSAGPVPVRPTSQAAALRWGAAAAQASEGLRMALLAMNAHRLRAALTMLGVIIGIASVVSMVAVGEGSRRLILDRISSIGTNTVSIYPGKDFGDDRAAAIHTLTAADVQAVATQPYVDSVTPMVRADTTLRRRNVTTRAAVNGVGEGFFRVHDVKLVEGRAFDHDEVRGLAQVAVIDENSARSLFGEADPIGEVILLGRAPVRVIGVGKASNLGRDETLNVWVPYTTAQSRLLGQPWLQEMTVRIRGDAPQDVASDAIVRLLTLRHGAKDVFAFSSDAVRRAIESTTQILTLMISSIALISLIVGGIGVMNIMLVSVTERTREIGVRAAVGARRSDILSQFLIEAVLVCLVGGLIGVGLALGVAALVSALARGAFSMTISPASIVIAFAFSCAIGVGFGFMPARNAARLDPVEALARE